MTEIWVNKFDTIYKEASDIIEMEDIIKKIKAKDSIRLNNIIKLLVHDWLINEPNWVLWFMSETVWEYRKLNNPIKYVKDAIDVKHVEWVKEILQTIIEDFNNMIKRYKWLWSKDNLLEFESFHDKIIRDKVEIVKMYRKYELNPNDADKDILIKLLISLDKHCQQIEKWIKTLNWFSYFYEISMTRMLIRKVSDNINLITN